MTANDTICAISTPPGIGGIAVARISGPKAIDIANAIWHGRPLTQATSHTAHLGTIVDTDGQPLDQALATIFRAPRSFTGENVVELSVHGSRFVQRELLNTLMAAGARLAQPGEFTRRAFAAGRMDLAEAEAVADVIASNSRAAHRIAISQMRGLYSRRLAQLRQQLLDLASLIELELDFSEEEVEFASRQQLRDLAQQIHTQVTTLHKSFAAGAAIKNGIPVAIVGPTNAGKSSLLNTILGDDRAIVSDIHGTTRDTVEETIELGDYLFRFIDTAGIRLTTDTIEQIGIQRSISATHKAAIIILLIDPTSPSTTDPLLIDAINDAHQQSQPQIILATNKSDLKPHPDFIPPTLTIPHTPISISATTNQGIDRLRQALQQAAQTAQGDAHENTLVTNARHAQALAQAAQSSARIIQALAENLPGDLIAQDIRETIHHLSTITGNISTPEILQQIFTRFCIGK